jgi:predicted hotdog family 3-hydroxylacyl-ACP dehydratase
MTAAAEVLPHEGDAVLLQQVWAVDATVTRATATVSLDTPFVAADGRWPAWLAIEIMAQAVAGSAGLREYRPGVRPRLGLLLGARNLECKSDAFASGTALLIEVTESSRDEHGMGVYDCTIDADGTRIASATLSVYLPASVDDYLGSLEP